MISSSRCSSRRRALGAAIALTLVALAGCRHAGRVPPPALKLAVFPVQNASGGLAPIRALTDGLDAALAERGLDVVPRRELDSVLAAHRIRFTGGVDREMARVLREELAVDAVLIPTLELYASEVPPRVAIAVRLVDVDERPVVLWADVVARSGDDSPGLLALGVVNKASELNRTVVAGVARSVHRYALSRATGDACSAAGRFQPRRAFRAPVLDDVGRRSIVVLPFTNESPRRNAGELLVEQFVSQLARSGSFEVLDPGVVREELLSHRVVLEGGVSLDNAMAMLSLLNADLVVSGYVHSFESPASATAPPKVAFTAYVIDGRTAELIWSSASDGGGDDGVFFFDAGRVYNASSLSCRMVRGVVDGIRGHRPVLGAALDGSANVASRRGNAQFWRRPAAPK